MPSKPFTSALAGIHISGNNSPIQKVNSTSPEIDKSILTKKLSFTELSVSNTGTDNTDFNQVIFNSNILTKPCDNVDSNSSLPERAEEEVRLMPQEVVQPQNSISKLSCNGADADLSWIGLMVCIGILIFAVPLIYVLYVAEHPEQFHHHHEHDHT